MNTTVTVTGMEARTKVGSNLLIASAETSTTAIPADSLFKTSHDAAILDAYLEPVSSVNGTNFFYTNSTNVGGSGDALSDVYVAYDPSSTTAFNTNYGTTGAEGYKDYAFFLKANNDGAAANLNITDITLTYGSSDTAATAFRAAVFVEDLTTGAGTATAGVGTLKTILGKNADTCYFTDGCAVSAIDSVPTSVSNYNAAATLAQVPANSTNYYKVVVRFWLEGEDESCNNSVFNTLTYKWALYMTIKLGGSPASALTTASTTGKADLSTASAVTTDTVIVDGVTYYPITGATLNSKQLYTLASGSVTNTSKIYRMATLDGANHPIDVTNQCTLPAAD